MAVCTVARKHFFQIYYHRLEREKRKTKEGKKKKKEKEKEKKRRRRKNTDVEKGRRERTTNSWFSTKILVGRYRFHDFLADSTKQEKKENWLTILKLWPYRLL